MRGPCWQTQHGGPLMEHAQRFDELHDRITAAVAEIATGERWQEMLAVAARFHTYSANNVWLILAQHPTATRVAGYRTWQQLGRQVRRGERGLAIFAPCLRKTETTDEPAGAEPRRVLSGFRVVHVFDISQTDGDDLPAVRPTLLAGYDAAGLWDRLAAQVHAAGYTLERGECGGANGYSHALTHTVRVRDDVSDRQGAKTLAHELAHVLLHSDPPCTKGERDVAEVEAESVGYVVCTAA